MLQPSAVNVVKNLSWADDVDDSGGGGGGGGGDDSPRSRVTEGDTASLAGADADADADAGAAPDGKESDGKADGEGRKTQDSSADKPPPAARSPGRPLSSPSPAAHMRSMSVDYIPF